MTGDRTLQKLTRDMGLNSFFLEEGERIKRRNKKRVGIFLAKIKRFYKF